MSTETKRTASSAKKYVAKTNGKLEFGSFVMLPGKPVEIPAEVMKDYENHIKHAVATGVLGEV